MKNVAMCRWGGACVVLVTLMTSSAVAQQDGLLSKDCARLFPIGFYELPKDDEALARMAEAGVNLVHCHSREDLDRVHAVGMQGVYPLPFQQGATDKLRERVEAVADHPALAVWEGPDEIVWNFTATSGLHRKLGVHKTPGEWWRQTPEAVAYAEEQAAKIIPNMRAAVEMIRAIDTQDRPVWINEALYSDVYYVRQYLDFVDITGCDIYPIHADKREPARLGAATDRWRSVGRDKPVWMVLQAFSWHELGDYYGAKEPAYPTFAESRLMAYDSIAHGASGILYWGSRFLQSEPVRESIYALTGEFAKLQSFLVAPEVPGVGLDIIEIPEESEEPHVRVVARRVGENWLIAIVNEDDVKHMAVVVEGLDALEDRTLHLLYEMEERTVSQGEITVRIQPGGVKVFCTDRAFETPARAGRSYPDE